MRRIFISIIALALSSPAFCEVTTEIYCFSAGGDNGKDFELRTYYDQGAKWSGGLVKYRGSKTPITLVVGEIEVEQLSKDSPAQVTTTWLEVYGNKITGKYEMMRQGAMIYSMTYINIKSRKETGFLFNPNTSSSPESGCQW